MLLVKKLNAGYRELHILYNVTFEAFDGKITAVIGPNGSGKSTLMKSIFGLTTIYSGHVFLNKIDVTDISPHNKARMGMAYLPQIENVFTNLTVEENLKIGGYPLDEDSYLEGVDLALKTFPELEGLMKRKAGTLSGGERQFLAISTALIRKAEHLLLDEPTAQLSPKLANVMFQKISIIREKLGISVTIVEQDIQNALEISDDAYVLINGRVAFRGTSNELRNDERFEKLCMGVC